MMFFSLPLLALLATTTSKSRPIKPYVKTDHLILQKISSSSNCGGVVFVDLENVRGKSGFELSHMQVIEKTRIWMEHHKLMNKVIVIADHGSKQEGYYLENRDLALVFAGPNEKADDVIAKGVGMFDDKTTSLVITADGELQSRCRRNAPSGGTLHIMDPAKFLDDLELAALKSGINMEEQEQEEALASSSLSLGEQIKLGQLDAEIKLRGQLLDLEIQLGKKPKMTNKRRKKLGAKINKLKENLALRGPSLLDQITSIDDSRLKTNGENGNLGIDHRQQDLLLSRWREIQNRSSRREQTGDRVVYAEQLRRQIMDNEETVMNFDLGEKDNWPPAQSFVMHMNGFMSIPENKYDSGIGPKNSILPNEIKGFVGDTDISPPAFSTYELLNTVHGTRSSSFTSNGSKIDTLKLVVVSDTHGFEGQLVDPETSSDILPEGDILLHLGDFAKEGSFEQEMNSLRAFDTWLAKQPHKYKVIVRGNHDPFICDFPLSGAWYVTKPTTILIPNDRQQEQQSFVLGVVPHGSPRNLSASKCIPSSCDILATHLPPFKTGLDRTYTGKNVGSPFLSKIVRSMGDQAPRLWFCGHIHEGRGVYKKQFSGSSSRETTIINAANANSGRATHLQHGPVVVQLAADGNTKILEMEDKSIDLAPSNQKFFENPTNDNVNDLLLAVDIGLKSGVALYNRQGALVRYEQFYFDRNTLASDAEELVQQWENDINNETDLAMEYDDVGNKPWKITHIAMEGADAKLMNAWADAAPNRSILRVSPEEWRSGLLVAKERKSGPDAKAASRLIARQIVGDFGVMEQHSGKFKTDVAEAVVMGFYVARKLGWITREPAVQRYTNGVIMVPK